MLTRNQKGTGRAMNDDEKQIVDGGLTISGSMAAVAIAIIIQLLGLQSLSWYLTAALFCFAGAIPLLVLCFTVYFIVPQRKDIRANLYQLLLLISSFATVVGLCFVFFHLNTIAGGIFVSSLILTIIIEIKRKLT
jgi:hypothetical protein